MATPFPNNVTAETGFDADENIDAKSLFNSATGTGHGHVARTPQKKAMQVYSYCQKHRNIYYPRKYKQ